MWIYVNQISAFRRSSPFWNSVPSYFYRTSLFSAVSSSKPNPFKTTRPPFILPTRVWNASLARFIFWNLTSFGSFITLATYFEIVVRHVLATPGCLSSVYSVFTVLIPCWIVSSGDFALAFSAYYSMNFFSSNGMPLRSHLSLSILIRAAFLASASSILSFFLYSIAILASCSSHALLAAACAFPPFNRLNSISWSLIFFSSSLRIFAALIFSSAILIRSSLDRPPWYYVLIEPWPS